MTVRLYRSTDFGAPTLTGAAGGMLPIFDSCLVSGYGDQTVTITRSGSTATITTPTAHGFARYAMVTISGAGQPEYNGDKACTVTGGTTLTFPVSGVPATPATGTITMRLSGAGWTKAFSGTNKGAYRQGTGSNGLYLRVDDGPVNLARVVGYESMTAVDTGTNAFPTDTQFPGGLYQAKSTDTTTARQWVMLATEKFFVLITNVNNGPDGASSQAMFFGDLVTEKTGDAFHTQIIAGISATATSSSNFYNLNPSLSNAAVQGHYIARPHNQSSGALQNSKVTNTARINSSNTMGTSGLPYPSPINNGLYLSTIDAAESSAIRGKYPGIWCPNHNRPLAHMDFFTGSGSLAGKLFLAVGIYSSAQVFLEVSDTY